MRCQMKLKDTPVVRGRLFKDGFIFSTRTRPIVAKQLENDGKKWAMMSEIKLNSGHSVEIKLNSGHVIDTMKSDLPGGGT